VASSRRRLRPGLALVLGALGFASLSGCGAASRFPLREPLRKDPDETPFSHAPEEYVSPFAWDGANQIVFRPIARFFAVDPAGRATNVNSFDEVPDSSWFRNRIGSLPFKAMSPAELARGPCGDNILDVNAKDGSWVIDRGKSNGANPGFRVNVPGVGKFMLKVDPESEPDRATGATAIAARLYHAAGYFAPCDSVVYFRPSVLSLEPGLTVTDNSGVTRPFDAKALEHVLAAASRRGGLVRMGASRWLPGRTLGPYRYEGTRDDDPNDVVPHEDRRELRGARLLAAWLNHFDSREQNTMDVFLQKNKKDPRSPGFVEHYILDLGDCFGSVWKWDEISRRLGFAYYLDVPYLAEDFVTFGAIERPWERVRRDGGIFNYFSARDFEPELWRGGYPNPAFARMTEADGAWMARILAQFTDELVSAAVDVGQYDDASTRYLKAVLVLRRDAILRRYLTRLSPLAGAHLEGDALCATDLAARSHVGDPRPGYRAARRSPATEAQEAALPVVRRTDNDVCVALTHTATDGGIVDDDASRYVIIDTWTSSAPGPLRAHLYDLGPARGFRLVGLERPE
jgi:hypothetical protein